MLMNLSLKGFFGDRPWVLMANPAFIKGSHKTHEINLRVFSVPGMVLGKFQAFK